MFKEEPLSAAHSRNGFASALKLLALLLVLTTAGLISATVLGALSFDTLANVVGRVGVLIGVLGSTVALGWLLTGQRRA